MEESILLMNGVSVEILKELSYRSSLGQSLKKNLHYFDKNALIDELIKMTEWLDEKEVLSDIALDYRIKSYDSIIRKYERYYPDSQVRKVFNDILGFRAFCDDYRDVLALNTETFRIADMSRGKAKEDGYRGVHIYFQIDNSYYPIEIQFNTFYDRQMNNWLHEYIYKREYLSSVGILMRRKYEDGEIRNEQEFQEVLENVLLNSKGF